LKNKNGDIQLQHYDNYTCHNSDDFHAKVQYLVFCFYKYNIHNAVILCRTTVYNFNILYTLIFDIFLEKIDVAVGVFNALYLRIPEDGTTMSKHVGILKLV
jgi:hypothetical protein